MTSPRQIWRDKKRALGLCIDCGKNPVMKVSGKERSKCRNCLIKRAIQQSIWRNKK